MEELVNLIATDAAANDISDKIKEALYAKAADKIDASRNTVGASCLLYTSPSPRDG